MDKYTAWEDVPPNLKTKTQLRKVGLKPDKGQKPAAVKTGGFAPYRLFDVDTAVPIKAPSPAQLAALAKARQAQYCAECGEHIAAVGRISDKGGVCDFCHTMTRARKRVMNRLAKAASGDYVVFDTETTGLDNPEIIHISFVDQHGRVILDERVRPMTAIEAGATAVHGHTAESLADCPTWPDIHGRVYELMEQRRVLAYNTRFDLDALHHTCRLHNTPEPVPVVTACIMEGFAAHFGDWSAKHHSFRWQSLSTAVGYLGLDAGDYHDAAGDALAAWRVLRALVKKGDTAVGKP